MQEYQLEWSCIYYHDELDTDNSVLYTEYVEEARHRGGWLIKSARITYHEDREHDYTESMVFVN